MLTVAISVSLPQVISRAVPQKHFFFLMFPEWCIKVPRNHLSVRTITVQLQIYVPPELSAFCQKIKGLLLSCSSTYLAYTLHVPTSCSKVLWHMELQSSKAKQGTEAKKTCIINIGARFLLYTFQRRQGRIKLWLIHPLWGTGSSSSICRN